MLELIDKKDVKKKRTTIVEHHTKYKELHGYDETKFMSHGEHVSLHARLRRENKCNIPSQDLEKISKKASIRCDKYHANMWLEINNRVKKRVSNIINKDRKQEKKIYDDKDCITFL